ncbi:MAG: hypothetical protein AAGA08_16800 [Pseudomonadota bacterium]
MSKSRFCLSPVDYEAWNKGYQPPNEHVLIHELMFEGAHVDSFSGFDGNMFWLVTKGKPFRGDGPGHDLQMRLLQEKIEEKKAVLVSCKFLRAIATQPLIAGT